MKNKILTVFFLISQFLFLTSSYAETSSGVMTEETFNRLIGRFESKIFPAAKVKTNPFFNLYVFPRWTADGLPTFWFTNLLISKEQSAAGFFIVGDFARAPLLTEDGFILNICTQVGQFVGGAPMYYPSAIYGSGNDNKNFNYYTYYGQAAYYAASKCMRELLSEDDNISLMSGKIVDSEVIKKCELVYSDKKDIALCKRVSMAAKSLVQVMESVKPLSESDGSIRHAAFDTPDLSVARKVLAISDMSAQCILDSFFSGALCDKRNEEVSRTDPTTGVCLKKDGYKYGVRPLCWYKPSSIE